jgi:transposase-like protein
MRGVHHAQNKKALPAGIPGLNSGAGRTPEELSREFEPSAQSISNWVAQAYRAGGKRVRTVAQGEPAAEARARDTVKSRGRGRSGDGAEFKAVCEFMKAQAQSGESNPVELQALSEPIGRLRQRLRGGDAGFRQLPDPVAVIEQAASDIPNAPSVMGVSKLEALLL